MSDADWLEVERLRLRLKEEFIRDVIGKLRCEICHFIRLIGILYLFR